MAQAPSPIRRRRRDMPDKPQLIPAISFSFSTFSMGTDEEKKTECVPPPRQAPTRPIFKVLKGPQKPAETVSTTQAVVDDSLLKLE